MPQLKIETFVTQYFWLIVILLGFYYVLVTVIIPRISEVIKTRKRLETVASSVGKVDTLAYENTLVLPQLITLPKTETTVSFKNQINSWAADYVKKGNTKGAK